MKILGRFLLIISILCFTLFIGCEEDSGTEPGNGEPPTISLAGVYDLFSFYDKVDETNYIAGEPHQEGSITTTVTGDLVLTESTYVMTLEFTVEVSGYSATEETVDQGSYQIVDNNTLKGHSDENNDNFTMGYQVQGNQLTLEDAESKMVWEKQ